MSPIYSYIHSLVVVDSVVVVVVGPSVVVVPGADVEVVPSVEHADVAAAAKKYDFKHF